jgi:3'-5' exonuclease
MLNKIDPKKIFYLDIETIPQHPSYQDLPEKLRELWDHKASFLKHEPEENAESLYERAGIYAEFGKIICISLGFLKGNPQRWEFRVKSLQGHDEEKILLEFNKILEDYFDPSQNFLCAHNGKEFDYPYIARRCLINGITLPSALEIAGKKPWETEHLMDTMQLWRFGDYKSFTSLNLLCEIFKIPTPKDDISGKDIAQVYWEEKNLKRIVSYCEKDVIAMARLFFRFKGLPYFSDEEIIHVE